MKVISFISQKGGAGKTTLALHLAVAWSQHGCKVALLDLDPQASAANWGDRRQDTDRLPHVRPAFASRLPQELNEIRKAGGEIVVLDTAPHSDNVTLGAAKVSDLVLIPCRPSIFDLEALAVTVELVKTAQVPILAVLNAVVPHVADTAQAEEAIGRLGVTVCPIHISRRVAFSRAVLRGLTAQEYEPQGKAAREIEQLFQTIQGVAQKEHAAGGQCDG